MKKNGTGKEVETGSVKEMRSNKSFMSVRNTVPSAALERVHRSVIKRPAYLLTQPCFFFFFFSAVTERPEFFVGPIRIRKLQLTLVSGA